MRFIDEAIISVKAGRWQGLRKFQKRSTSQRVAPDGGNGGRGGDIIFVADSRLSSLLDFRYKRELEAERGEHGMGSMCTGKDGFDLVVKVPSGTIIKDEDTGEVLADMVVHGQTYLACKGGRGGKGNAHFTSATHQTPRFAQPGEPGTGRKLKLELKLLADVGIIGFPNAESTLISTSRRQGRR